MSSFECKNTVLNITDKNNSYSITLPGHWNSISAENTVDDLNKLLKLKSENKIELHVQEVRKRGTQIKIGDKE